MRKVARSEDGEAGVDGFDRLRRELRRFEFRLIGLVVVLIGGGWIWYGWSQGGADMAALAAGGLFLLTLLVAWRSFELVLAAFQKHFELQQGLEGLDAKSKRLAERLRAKPDA